MDNGSLGGWLQKSLNPDLESSVIFLDTCGGAREIRDSANMVVNMRENEIVAMVLQAVMDVSCTRLFSVGYFWIVSLWTKSLYLFSSTN